MIDIPLTDPRYRAITAEAITPILLIDIGAPVSAAITDAPRKITIGSESWTPEPGLVGATPPSATREIGRDVYQLDFADADPADGSSWASRFAAAVGAELRVRVAFVVEPQAAPSQEIAFARQDFYGGSSIAVEPTNARRTRIVEPALLADASDRRLFAQLRLYWESLPEDPETPGTVELDIVGARNQDTGDAGDDLSDDFEREGKIRVTIDGETLEIAMPGSARDDPYTFVAANAAEVADFARRKNVNQSKSGTVELVVGGGAEAVTAPLDIYRGRCSGSSRSVEDGAALTRAQFTGPFARLDDSAALLLTDPDQRRRSATDTSLRFVSDTRVLTWGR